MALNERSSSAVSLDTLFKKQVDLAREALQNFNAVVPLNSASLWKSALGELVSTTVCLFLFSKLLTY